jgi:hypothetical protein
VQNPPKWRARNTKPGAMAGSAVKVLGGDCEEVLAHLTTVGDQHFADSLHEGELPLLEQAANTVLGDTKSVANVLGTPNQV